MTIRLTKREAFRFLLEHQGLIGAKRFQGKAGILSYIRQAGCIQFDPVDVCGKNADLTLQSRVSEYRPRMLWNLLYEDRDLIDYFDKNLSILPIEDWPLCRDAAGWFLEDGRSRSAAETVRDEVIAAIRTRGPLCSADLALTDKVPWFWADSPLGRVVLESLYYEGVLIIHHKEGTRKYYALTEDHISPDRGLNASKASRETLRDLRVFRRIGAVGMLWNRRSDAFLSIADLHSPERNHVFETLVNNGLIVSAEVEGMSSPLYLRKSDEPRLRASLERRSVPARVEFLAPLDPMMWDRNLIRELTGFDYTWEIYTVEAKRKFGYYVLPLLYGDRLVGRVEFVCDRKKRILILKNRWLEPGFRSSNRFETAFAKATERFQHFNDCDQTEDRRCG
ncbi:MAG TPA: crosslink repair DNA glycosylase YcaQ family protein [Candidatus Izemoplasmatales bacterium]|nr:crosslink repair DNA glycosylase YcaQ family protein [Candidatus Izemoplasmatales bacterium]